MIKSKKTKRSIKEKLNPNKKVKSKLQVKKQRTGIKDKVRKIRDLNETEQIRLKRILKKLEASRYYDKGWNRVPDGFTTAKVSDFDMEIIDVYVEEGVKGGKSDTEKIEINRKTMEIIKNDVGNTMDHGGSVDEGKYQTNVHGEKPTDYKIICKIVRIGGKEAQVCYHETNDKKLKGVEVYSGKNYIYGSNDSSYSKKYDELSDVPVKYKSIVNELISAHHKKFDCGGSMATGGVVGEFIVDADEAYRFNPKTGLYHSGMVGLGKNGIKRMLSNNQFKKIKIDNEVYHYNPKTDTYNYGMVSYSPDEIFKIMERGGSMATGGEIAIGKTQTKDGEMIGKVVYNDYWKTYQVSIDGVIYEEFKTPQEAIENLKSAGFKNLEIKSSASSMAKGDKIYSGDVGSGSVNHIPKLNKNATWEEVKNYLLWLRDSPYAYHIDDNPEDVFDDKKVIEVLRHNSDIVWDHSNDIAGTNIWEVYHPLTVHMDGLSDIIDEDEIFILKKTKVGDTTKTLHGLDGFDYKATRLPDDMFRFEKIIERGGTTGNKKVVKDGGISSKAEKILHEGKAHGKPITEQQRKFFGARASGYPVKKKYSDGSKIESKGRTLIKLGILEQKLNNKGVFLKDYDENGIGANATYNPFFNKDTQNVKYEIEGESYDIGVEQIKLPEDIINLIDEYNSLSVDYYG